MNNDHEKAFNEAMERFLNIMKYERPARIFTDALLTTCSILEINCKVISFTDVYFIEFPDGIPSNKATNAISKYYTTNPWIQCNITDVVDVIVSIHDILHENAKEILIATRGGTE